MFDIDEFDLPKATCPVIDSALRSMRNIHARCGHLARGKENFDPKDAPALLAQLADQVWDLLNSIQDDLEELRASNEQLRNGANFYRDQCLRLADQLENACDTYDACDEG